jgi:hypothetical protein
MGAERVVITDLPEVCALIDLNIDLNAHLGGRPLETAPWPP